MLLHTECVTKICYIEHLYTYSCPQVSLLFQQINIKEKKILMYVCVYMAHISFQSVISSDYMNVKAISSLSRPRNRHQPTGREALKKISDGWIWVPEISVCGMNKSGVFFIFYKTKSIQGAIISEYLCSKTICVNAKILIL